MVDTLVFFFDDGVGICYSQEAYVELEVVPVDVDRIAGKSKR